MSFNNTRTSAYIYLKSSIQTIYQYLPKFNRHRIHYTYCLFQISLYIFCTVCKSRVRVCQSVHSSQFHYAGCGCVFFCDLSCFNSMTCKHISDRTNHNFLFTMEKKYIVRAAYRQKVQGMMAKKLYGHVFDISMTESK